MSCSTFGILTSQSIQTNGSCERVAAMVRSLRQDAVSTAVCLDEVLEKFRFARLRLNNCSLVNGDKKPWVHIRL